MIRITKHVLYDILRNRFVILYALFLMVITLSLFSLDSDPGKAVLSLMNIILMVVPLVSIIFTTIYFFNSYEFIELLLSQPIDRKVIFFSEYIAASFTLSVAYLLGVGVPIFMLSPDWGSLYLVFAGLLLTWVFVSLAFAASVSTRDKARGIGIALLFWFYFGLIYDGFMLYIIYSFSDYPMEKVTLALVSFNPVDLARIVILLKLDISALMGYTGAFYKSFFGTSLGTVFSASMLVLWIVLPLIYSLRKFLSKDI
ncbi:MAG: ABC transporter permease subunit [Cyclobacteriaceae bacterium]|nr:ABC transporter permease subunit [Cyclobacteriaceae bacterium]